MPELILDVVDGIHCAGCVRRLEKTMDGAPGVSGLQVDLVGRTARMHLDGGGLDRDAVIARLGAAGFDARPAAPPGSAEAPGRAGDDESRRARLDALVAAALAASCMCWAMLVHSQASGWIQGALALAALAWPGRHVLRRGAASAARLAGDMDVLVSLGAAASFAHGAAGLALGWHHLHFESAAMIIAFTLVGRALEARARAATGAAVAALLARQPQRAALLTADGERQVDAATLRPGDRIRIRPGEALPADGTVAEGGAEVDEAMLSGEPMPVEKRPGDMVLAGSLARLGTLVVRVGAGGAATQLARAAAAMRAAQAARPPVARLADRVAAVFVPVAIGLAAATLGAWWLLGGPKGLDTGIVAAIDVLVIACPCALGLATPAAIAAAVGRAARLGVLVRSGPALEALAGCTVVALDKTGTITAGRPVVAGVVTAPHADRATVLRLAAAAETGSEHPLARAIRDAAGADIPAAAGFIAEPGGGVRAEVDGTEVLVGTAEWLAGRGVPAQPGTPGPGTVAHVAAGGRWIGSIRCADEIRPEAPGAVAALRALGLRPLILTGDRAEEARRVGVALAVGEVRSRQMPVDKADAVAALESAGDRVLAVGDGVNDAAMLARASCGAAVGGGADIAAQAGGLVVDGRHPLAATADAVRLSRATMRIIRQNLAVAAVYNLAAIPVAAGILVPFHGPLLDPAWAAAAMAASSLCVVMNALRLTRWRP